MDISAEGLQGWIYEGCFQTGSLVWIHDAVEPDTYLPQCLSLWGPDETVTRTSWSLIDLLLPWCPFDVSGSLKSKLSLVLTAGRTDVENLCALQVSLNQSASRTTVTVLTQSTTLLPMMARTQCVWSTPTRRSLAGQYRTGPNRKTSSCSPGLSFTFQTVSSQSF